jgi:O-antigen/teichoic acid export membrane protein
MIGEVALGQFRLVERFALLASFPLTVVNSVYPGHIAEAYFEGNLARLQRLAGSMSLLALMGALPVVLVGALQPEFLLGLAGEPIAGSALLLRILLIVQLFNAATGPAGLVLFMAGKEAWVRRVVLGVSILSVPLGAIAIWQMGTVGAALMVSAVVISNNLAFFVLNVRKLGIVPLPSFGSLRIMWRDEERS